MAGGAGLHDDDHEERLITEINVTPMVDIMLVLLIVFMVTASFIVSPSMKVELPSGSGKAQADRQPDVVVVVNRSGGIEMRQRKLSLEQMVETLRREHQAKPSARLLVVADRKAYHGTVVRVMDAARSIGFERLGVAVEGQP
ncbi:MAG: biopolymer transporter ExbD [Proteobacteria bacterium]|nr:biopolymer transporter ExbD [Pseudomonadota bacterium]